MKLVILIAAICFVSCDKFSNTLLKEKSLPDSCFTIPVRILNDDISEDNSDRDFKIELLWNKRLIRYMYFHEDVARIVISDNTICPIKHYDGHTSIFIRNLNSGYRASYFSAEINNGCVYIPKSEKQIFTNMPSTVMNKIDPEWKNIKIYMFDSIIVDFTKPLTSNDLIRFVRLKDSIR